NKPCYSESAARDYCGPKSFEPLPNRFFRNNGDGTFVDASASSQIARSYHGALGVVAVDLTGDHRLDLFIANDGRVNELWIAQPDGTFQEDAGVRGVALDQHGRALASMGVEAADFDNDGDSDLFTTHLTSELHTFYRNNGDGRFVDRSVEVGLKSRIYTGFGTSSFDFDNDGWLDLFMANGAVKTVEALATKGDPFPLHQPNQLFRNDGKGRFLNVSAEAGTALAVSEVSRGTATGDIDNDGDPDLVVTNNNGWARILRNDVGTGSHWVGVRVRDAANRIDLVGTLIEVKSASGKVQHRRARTDGSYCSANDPRVLVGLGTEGAIEYVRLHYVDGSTETWHGLAADRYHTLLRGTGKKP
ncbi:MAG: CRTAC1 family protein, partial [Planctomycetes bacterium]|nr:CRTAC1 family protein [Planctomycetota bacterium]